MAKGTGYFCDQCKTFEVTTDNQPPMGWMRVTVRTNYERVGDGFDLCSNRCLTAFGRERQRAERGEEASSNGTGHRPLSPTSTSDGLTRVAGMIDQYLRTGDEPVAEFWWEAYDTGERQPAGRGYTWVCPLSDKERGGLADYLEACVRGITEDPAPQTDFDRKFKEAVSRILPGLRDEEVAA